MILLRKYGWLLLLPMIVIAGYFFQTKDETDELQISETTTKKPDLPVPSENNGKWVVDVKGEVVHPGIYEMDQGTRVNDAVKNAGGFTEKADKNSINLAQKLQDEMVILVLSIDQMSQESQSVSNEKVAVNRAGIDEIQNLPGIGPSKAEKIFQYREENGGFQSVEELLEVPGIGEKTLENMKEMIQIP
ncbi:helix-hairpin-helix domain-containing protein [Halobacillus massiliensis]|uniref:helix-hairpin-helix domain-containing protein n=1 Tax=Halobacillus massiliensis TaxID=1926286 RepID=UPI001FE5371B|nr:helix-hairpin-helix domain-containing protein [Halobacillus massiliensis]